MRGAVMNDALPGRHDSYELRQMNSSKILMAT
jgi:hypothetical protein